MKPVYARIWDVLESYSKGQFKNDKYFVVFHIKDDQEKVQELRFFVENNKVKVEVLVTEKMAMLEEPEPWQRALFDLWNENKNTLDRWNHVFKFNNDNWSIEVADVNTIFPLHKINFESTVIEEIPESSIGEDLSKLFTSCWSCFFSKEDEFIPYKFSRGEDSKFERSQVEAIVNQINILEREKRSVWAMNKDRKDQKIAGLKNLLEESTKPDAEIYLIIAEARRAEEMVEGTAIPGIKKKSRVESLLDYLELPSHMHTLNCQPNNFG